MNKKSAERGIYTTFFGVGIDFNTKLIEQICKAKGCSYYSIANEEDFLQLLYRDFDYMVFPVAFDVKVKTN
jgi:Ca-activated chloride channel family protein